jgi:NADPH:quinone reductase-like Zn-dependent oxidoreductase
LKALICSGYGDPDDVLKVGEIERPVPKDNEVLIKVYATTVSRTDCGVLWGKPFILRFFAGLSRPKNVTGTDFAGIIEAVGTHVSLFKVGDRVHGFDDMGLKSHAEYMTFPENKGISTIPGNISFEQAVASIEGGHYAYNFLNKVNILAGQKVLVNGTSGAIGSACLQFLKSSNVYVTAVCSSESIAIMKEFDADNIIDYTRYDFTKDKEVYDFIFDAVGKSTFGKCKPLLKKEGVYISSELGPNNENPLLAIMTSIVGEKKVKFPFPYSIKTSLQFIDDLLAQGKYKPLIGRTYPMEKIPEAFKYAASGQKLGNIIITI